MKELLWNCLNVFWRSSAKV